MGKRRCQVCGSKQWHKEPLSGLIACEEGHILQNYRNEAEDTGEDFTQRTLTKRRLKSERKKKEESRANPELYHGLRARLLYFECLQLLLRLQIQRLVDIWKLPSEYEGVCREVWALHLSLLPEAIPERDAVIHEDDSKVQESQTGLATQSTLGPSQEKHALFEDGSDSEDEKEHPLGHDVNMEDLLRENSVASSSSDEGEDGTANDDSPVARMKSKRRGIDKRESPASLISILAISCWILRIPIMYRDFIHLIESYELPYLSLLQHIPQHMLSHVNKYLKQTLTPQHAPRTTYLHSVTSRICERLHTMYSINVPELNAAPVLWRITKHMAGTPVLYGLVKRLSEILALPLTLHQVMAPELANRGKRKSVKFQHDNVAPEVSLLAALVIVLKMVYGLDGKARVPEDGNDPACVLPDLKSYLAVIKKFDDYDASTREQLFSSQNDLDVATLADDTLDAYLDFCQHALVSERVEDTNRVLESHFQLEGVKKIGRSGTAEPPFPSELPPTDFNLDDRAKVLRPGEEYEIYRAQDVLGTLPADYNVIVTRGSRWLEVSEEELTGIVERYERRLDKWWQSRRRKLKNEPTAA